MAATLWIDVEDLFEYARTSARPSGIQRLAFEIWRELQRRSDEHHQTRFVRHDPIRNSLRVVPWSDVETLFAGLSTAPVAPPILAGEIRPHSPFRRFWRTWTHRLPRPLRIGVTDVMLSHVALFQAWWRLFALLARAAADSPAWIVRHCRRREAGGRAPEAVEAFADLVRPGDVLLVLGSPWSHPSYGALVQALRARHGLRFALLVYDLIPLRRPEWFDRGLVRLFRAWFEAVLPIADHLFAISRATAADVERYAREHGISLPGSVVPVPIGTGFGIEAPAIAAPRSARLPVAGSYALIVSTIEARKNHQLLFRVWRRLLDEMPSDRIPTLVFAGRIGWLVDDLMHQIANTANLDGKLVVIESPTDAELTALYQGCLFTLFPSFYEGWGLPVTESLAYGKPCLMSDRTSLPEAGVGLARSFDPDDFGQAYAAVLATIQDPAGLAAWAAEIQCGFKPVPWSATVDAMLAGLKTTPPRRPEDRTK